MSNHQIIKSSVYQINDTIKSMTLSYQPCVRSRYMVIWFVWCGLPKMDNSQCSMANGQWTYPPQTIHCTINEKWTVVNYPQLKTFFFLLLTTSTVVSLSTCKLFFLFLITRKSRQSKSATTHNAQRTTHNDAQGGNDVGTDSDKIQQSTRENQALVELWLGCDWALKWRCLCPAHVLSLVRTRMNAIVFANPPKL